MADPVAPPYEASRRDGVLRISRPETEWLSTGPNGGRITADDAYNVSVPEEWARTELTTYATDRLDRAGFDGETDGPVLFTGVGIEDARGARYGPVTVYATAGISNPAALPMDPTREADSDQRDVTDTDRATETDADRAGTTDTDRLGGPDPTRGTVNLVVGTTRSLADGALENLIAVAAEAKAATLLAETGFPGTTTDAIVVGHDPAGERTTFSGSATEVGAATRACTRAAVRASLQAHYTDTDSERPTSVDEATYGVSTDVQAEVFRPSIAQSDDR